MRVHGTATCIIISAYLHYVILGFSARAHMEGLGEQALLPYEDTSNISADCGASICITGSFENKTVVVEKAVFMDSDMAKSGTSTKSLHMCKTTCSLKNRSGAVLLVPVT